MQLSLCLLKFSPALTPWNNIWGEVNHLTCHGATMVWQQEDYGGIIYEDPTFSCKGWDSLSHNKPWREGVVVCLYTSQGVTLCLCLPLVKSIEKAL